MLCMDACKKFYGAVVIITFTLTFTLRSKADHYTYKKKYNNNTYNEVQYMTKEHNKG